MDDVLYLQDGDAFVGTTFTQGPWSPEHQHGGPVQALLARAVEAAPTLAPMHVVRLTFDLFRPVPLGQPLTVATDVLREGKRIQLVDATMRAGDVELVRCRALRLRDEDTSALPIPSAAGPARRLPPPDGIAPTYREDLPGLPGVIRAMDLRRFDLAGAEGASGFWLRLQLPVVAGEEPTALQRLALAADFANALGLNVDPRRFSAINPDGNLHVVRLPTGPWVGVVGSTRLDPTVGTGISSAELHDEDGLCAVVSISQLVQAR